MRDAFSFVLFGLLLACQARALPPERVIALEPGADRFEKGLPGKWTAVSENPKVVEVEAFETAEVHLQARGEGTALVMLINRSIGHLVFWKVRVGGGKSAPSRPDPSGLQGPCNCGRGGYPLSCSVAGLECVEALRGLLEKSDLTTADLRLKFTVQGLQALLRDFQPRLAREGFGQIALAFSGVNLRTEGTLPDEAAWRRLMLVLYRGMVGKLLLDDRTRMAPGGGGHGADR